MATATQPLSVWQAHEIITLAIERGDLEPRDLVLRQQELLKGKRCADSATMNDIDAQIAAELIDAAKGP